MKIANIGAVCAAGVVVAAAGSAEAGLEVLLIVDLSVENEITITATDGFSSASIADTDNLGIYFEDFYLGAGGESVFTSGTGDLRAAGTVSDGTPGLFRAEDDPGLNFWSWTNDPTSTFTDGAIAFEGSATWTVNAAEYADMLAGATSGELWYPADTFDDLSSATLLGAYRVIPTPGVLSLCGVAGVMGIRRRR